MNFKFFCCALLAAGFLSACTYERNEGNSRLTPATATRITKGVTTKEQVRTFLGNPQSTKIQVPILQPPGVPPLRAKHTATEIWAYWSSSDTKPLFPFATAKTRHTSYTIIIYFDATGTVLDCETEDIHS